MFVCHCRVCVRLILLVWNLRRGISAAASSIRFADRRDLPLSARTAVGRTGQCSEMYYNTLYKPYRPISIHDLILCSVKFIVERIGRWCWKRHEEQIFYWSYSSSLKSMYIPKGFFGDDNEKRLQRKVKCQLHICTPDRLLYTATTATSIIFNFLIRVNEN
jgi:hypothetical protein